MQHRADASEAAVTSTGSRHPAGPGRIVLLIWLAGFIVPCGAQTGRDAAPQAAHQPQIDDADLALRIHTNINAERARHRLPPLAWDPALARIAVKHSRDMAKRGYLSHASPEGDDFDDRYRQGGYSCQVRVGRVIHTGAENIALGRLYNSVRTKNGVAYYDWNSPQQIARKVVDGWMNSRGHRANILTPHWGREGIGVEIHPDNKVYVTQNFC